MTSIYTTHVPESSGGGLYLKITDGEVVKIRIASEPAIYQSESQPDEHGNTRLSTRYGWLVWNQDNQTPQILQQSATFFKNLAVLASDDEYGDPMNYDIKIKRSGAGLETTYTITPSANREPLGKTVRDELANIDLIEKLSASPYAQHVMWLADADKPKSQPHSDMPVDRPMPTINQAQARAQTQAQTQAQARAQTQAQTQAQARAVDEPINLDDIPF